MQLNAHTKNKIIMPKGRIVDATIVQASSSTKKEKKERDPYMKSVKKCNNRYFGCKAHIGVDKKSGLVHTVVTIPAKGEVCNFYKTEDKTRANTT